MTPSFALVTGLHWGAVLCFVAATFLVVTGAIFQKPRAERIGGLLVYPGIVLHTAGLGVWWRIVGHGPYISRFEVLSAYAWVLIVGYVVAERLSARVRAAGILAIPATFSMIAAALFLQPEIKQLPPTFRGIWLVLHIGFYNVAFCAVVLAQAFSAFYLLRDRGRLAWFRALPELPIIDLYAYRFAGFGFIFWAIGMLAGSIWAYESWNIFWNWDPVQTWSLIAWGLFGVYLHLRRFFGWRGVKAAWLFTACSAAVVAALFLTPIIESSIHAEYFK